MPYGSGPFSPTPPGVTIDPDDGATPVQLVSSEKLDASAGGAVYVIDSDGAHEAMDDVDQRVLLLIAFRAGPRPAVLDDRSLAARRNRIRAALAPLTSRPQPTIEIVSIVVERSAPGRTRELVEYRNLLTNTQTTAEAR